MTLATWLFVVPLLALFSFSVVAGAQTFGKPDTAKAVRALPSLKHVVEVEVEQPKHAEQGDGGGLHSVIERFSHVDHLVCSVTGSQLTLIQQHYETGRISLPVDGRTLDIVTVYGASDHDLRSYLGDGGVTCVLVQVSHVFFLPFDPHGS